MSEDKTKHNSEAVQYDVEKKKPTTQNTTTTNFFPV